MGNKILLGILIVWNLVLTFFVWQILSYYFRLTKGLKQGNLKRILKSILARGELVESSFLEFKEKLKHLEKENNFFLKRIGLVKFNPFSELGGDQSFSLAMLSKAGKGIVITSLHGRQTTRIYTKLVNGSKDRSKFSEEEIKAIHKAKGET